MSFKRVLIPGEISKQVSAMSYVQQIPAQCYTDFKEQQELSHQHQWQRFSCGSKVPPSDAAEGESRVECTASWDKQKVSSQLLANADCLVAFHA